LQQFLGLATPMQQPCDTVECRQFLDPFSEIVNQSRALVFGTASHGRVPHDPDRQSPNPVSSELTRMSTGNSVPSDRSPTRSSPSPSVPVTG
jgi:hypothetical protein